MPRHPLGLALRWGLQSTFNVMIKARSLVLCWGWVTFCSRLTNRHSRHREPATMSDVLLSPSFNSVLPMFIDASHSVLRIIIKCFPSCRERVLLALGNKAIHL